jgi:caffeoyl-CoA O-methyltransferase
MELVSAAAQDYAARFSPQEDPLLHSIEAENREHPQANMLSGHLQGKFLEMISLLLQPTYILEIGTFLGYSALCFVKGLKPGGELHTLELREEAAAAARANFRKSKTSNQIILHTGNALDVLRNLDRPWDLVFIDADKPGYLAYYDFLMPRLKPGSLVIADNVLFHGEVLEKNIKGKNALAIQAFNERVSRDQSVDQVMITLRDGLMLIRKK